MFTFADFVSGERWRRSSRPGGVTGLTARPHLQLWQRSRGRRQGRWQEGGGQVKWQGQGWPKVTFQFVPFGRQCIAGVFGFDLYVQKAGRGRNRKARCIDTPRVYSTNPYSICVSRRQILASFSIMSKTITSTPFRCPWLQAPLIRVVGMAIQCTPLSGQSAAPA